MSIVAELDVDHDGPPRSAAMNMAIDEALLECAKIPSIRFYRWTSPALSFGYFGKFVDVATYATQRDVVRRWTGGGIVFHGDDLTYSVVIPARHVVFSESSMSIYEKIHRSLRNALVANGERAELACVAGVADAAVSNCGYNGACFANPVHADVMVNGRKVAGAAQRRGRAGLLHQGSIQYVDIANGLAERFARELCDVPCAGLLSEAVLERARQIAEHKYQTVDWLRRR
jgi:lipoyl(octanoyl) transferase